MSKFEINKDGIDPNRVPKKTLYTGAQMPVIGLGTFGSDKYSHLEVAQAVKGAIAIGYRHIDCAAIYGNEDKIGEVFKEVLDSGAVTRQELWITSKVWNDMHDDVVASCEKTLNDLQLDYLDLFLVHWPFPNHHAEGCDITSRSLNAKPYIHENFMKTWAQMETLVARGLVKNIGTSNVTIPKMKLILRDCKIKPACNEMELHPHFQQPELFQFCLNNDIQPIGFSPVGSPSRPARDKVITDTVDIEDAVVLKIAERLNVHPAVVCVKWAVQRGQVPIPFSVHKSKYTGNLASVTQDPITDEEMQALAQIDKNCRLIKGDVFLWKDEQTWEALWDLNGEITPA